MINSYLNNQLSKNTDDKTGKLNSVAKSNYLQKFDMLLLLLRLKFHIRNIAIERKHQKFFKIMNCSYISTEEFYNLCAIECPDIFDL